MMTPIAYRPSLPAVQPVGAPAARPAKAAPALRFGACVNRETTATDFQRIVMGEDTKTRIHAIATAGGKESTNELMDVIIKLLLGEPLEADGQKRAVFDQAQNDYKLQKIAILAAVKGSKEGTLTPDKKQEVLNSLKAAKNKRHMMMDRSGNLLRLIDEAIRKLENPQHQTDSKLWHEMVHQYEHAQGGADHHHGAGGHHH